MSIVTNLINFLLTPDLTFTMSHNNHYDKKTTEHAFLIKIKNSTVNEKKNLIAIIFFQLKHFIKIKCLISSFSGEICHCSW